MAATRRDINRQRRLDSRYGSSGGILDARVRAVAGARKAMLEREPDAAFVPRQSLIDLAAVAEALAEDLPVPNQV